MGSLEQFESLVLSRSCIVLCISGNILCGCGQSFQSLKILQEHVQRIHETGGTQKVGLDKLFSSKFVFPLENYQKEEFPHENYQKEEEIKEESVRVVLPPEVTCVCLNEHDLGAFSGSIPCHLCSEDCDNLESLNKHVAEMHKVALVLVGQNILFERPVFKGGRSSQSPHAFFCPMLKCKYHIAESSQRNHFKTYKLLKQHYVKVHAAKTQVCDDCGQKFGSSTYLELHKKTCGHSFNCTVCGVTFPALESLQTHAR